MNRAAGALLVTIVLLSGCAVISRASVDVNGVEGNGASADPDLSANGHFVAFASTATNLTASDANGVESDVFRRNNENGVIARLSQGTRGNDLLSSTAPSITSDGALIAYESGVVGAQREIWLRRLVGSPTWERVDAAVAGQADGSSFAPDIAANGTQVAFHSDATNLVATDTNGVTDVFVRDLAGGIHTVSIPAGGGEADGPSTDATITSAGRYVAFVSSATNLVPGDTNGVADVFVRDTVAGTTLLVSADSGGGPADGASAAPAISGDGRYVTLSSAATDLVSGDTNGVDDVFVRDTQTGTTGRVSLDFDLAQVSGASATPAMARDGSTVAFASAAADLITGDANSVDDVFVRASVTPTITGVIGAVGAPGDSISITINGTGFSPGFGVGVTGGTRVDSVTYVSDTQLDADITIRGTVVPGQWAVSVGNASDWAATGAQCADCLTVTNPLTAGPVDEGFSGMAYPVPVAPVPGPHVNDVTVALFDSGGAPAGTDHVPAGTPVSITQNATDPDLVDIDWGGGITGRADRAEFWVIPDFIEFGDVVVDIDGTPTPIWQSDLAYNLVTPGSFDEAGTPGYDGIAGPIRKYLRCESTTWKIANQLFASYIVADGLYADDKVLVDKGATALLWGVTVPTFDGAGVFSLYRDCDQTTASDSGEQHHSSQWLAGLGRGTYLLAATKYAGEYRHVIDAAITHLDQLATALTIPSVRQYWIDRWLMDPSVPDAVYTHKFYMRAAGLAMAAGLIDDDAKAARWFGDAHDISSQGMDEQWASGVNPERGGHDVRYQMYGAWLAEVYHATLAAGPHRDDINTHVDQAVAWMETRIDPVTGAVDITGSTRTCVGTPLKNFYQPYHTLLGFLLWAQVDPGHAQLFDLSVLHDDNHATTGSPCP